MLMRVRRPSIAPITFFFSSRRRHTRLTCDWSPDVCSSDLWLHVQEDHFYVEALDPATGQPVPDGQLGELTFTMFTKEALPLLRYRTGDLARLDRSVAAGATRTTVRMSKVTGRVDDMLVVRGVNVFPSEVEQVVLADPAV